MKKLSLKKRMKSFGHAFRGIRLLFNEPNFWIHCFALVMVVSAGIIFQLKTPEWIALSLAIGFVLLAEAFNTALEHLADSITLEDNKFVKNAKDVSAAAVLLASITAVVIGCLVFLPYLFN